MLKLCMDELWCIYCNLGGTVFGLEHWNKQRWMLHLSRIWALPSCAEFSLQPECLCCLSLCAVSDLDLCLSPSIITILHNLALDAFVLSLKCSYVHHEQQKNQTTECCLETDSGSHARQISLINRDIKTEITAHKQVHFSPVPKTLVVFSNCRGMNINQCLNCQSLFFITVTI